MSGGRPRHFIIAGAQRSGTTLLYRLLDQHPEIVMARPLRPEPKFFLRGDWEEHGRAGYRTALFPEDVADEVLGEKTTSYLERPEAPERIVHLLPEARIVFLLREPIARAVSNYWFSVEHGAERLGLEEAFREEPKRREAFDRRRYSVSPYAYRWRGHYARFLESWRDRLPPDRMCILLLEDLLHAPLPTLQVLLRFLGVESGAPLAVPPRVSERERPEGMSAALRALLREEFAESNRALAERFGLDLSRWAPAGEMPAGPGAAHSAKAPACDGA